jgi:dUTP pyrophosphatase
VKEKHKILISKLIDRVNLLSMKEEARRLADKERRNLPFTLEIASDTVEIKIFKMKGAEDLPFPEKATEGSAGFDVRANIAYPVTISANSTALIPTGLKVIIPKGYEIQIRSRSGLALMYLTVLNSPGTIDSDYRGEIQVLLYNHGSSPFKIERGDRIAQMVVNKLPNIDYFRVIDEHEYELECNKTNRDKKGLGSSGIK